MSFNALRITITGNITYDNIIFHDYDEWGSLGVTDLFEDSQLVFSHKEGVFIVPDFNVRLIHLRGGKIIPPRDSVVFKRILVADDLNYVGCHLLDPKYYEDFGVPTMFEPFKQFTWICKDGLFIAPDYQIIYVTV